MRVPAKQGLTWTCLNRFFVCRGVPGSCAGTSGEGMYLQGACTSTSPLMQPDTHWPVLQDGLTTCTQHSGLSSQGAESLRRQGMSTYAARAKPKSGCMCNMSTEGAGLAQDRLSHTGICMGEEARRCCRASPERCQAALCGCTAHLCMLPGLLTCAGSCQRPGCWP